jgi:exodeoxyribonuclease V beta subunit
MLQQHVLEGDVGLSALSKPEIIKTTELLDVIKDFFRTEVRSEIYSLYQLDSILQNQSVDQLGIDLFRLIRKGMPIAEMPTYEEQFQNFLTAIVKLKQTVRFPLQEIVDSFEVLAPKRRNYSSEHEKVMHFKSLLEQTHWTKHDFEFLIRTGLTWLQLVTEKKKKSAQAPTHIVDFFDSVQKELYPIIEQARDPMVTYGRMASYLQKFLKEHLKEEEKFTTDDILTAVQEALSNSQFVAKIQQAYAAVIVDEFQDTDPIQWEIFRRLFLNQNDICLYLVGDPKQSIYGFRQADIYTYLSAATALGKKNHFSLATNYRSQALLVSALNTLFSNENSPGLMDLPHTDSSLEYLEVSPNQTVQTPVLSDSWKSIHFFIANQNEEKRNHFPLKEYESESFFPFIVQEIQRLHKCDGISFSQFAILVRDRYQALRLMAYLKQWGIPFIGQSSTNLADSPALGAMIEILNAVDNPQDASAVRTALGGKILGWDHMQVLSLEDSEQLEKILSQFFVLKKMLMQSGFAAFYQEFLQSAWNSERSVLEKLLLQDEGVDFYN